MSQSVGQLGNEQALTSQRPNVLTQLSFIAHFVLSVIKKITTDCLKMHTSRTWEHTQTQTQKSGADLNTHTHTHTHSRITRISQRYALYQKNMRNIHAYIHTDYIQTYKHTIHIHTYVHEHTLNTCIHTLTYMSV